MRKTEIAMKKSRTQNELSSSRVMKLSRAGLRGTVALLLIAVSILSTPSPAQLGGWVFSDSFSSIAIG